MTRNLTRQRAAPAVIDELVLALPGDGRGRRRPRQLEHGWGSWGIYRGAKERLASG